MVVLIDTNVLLDVIVMREPYWEIPLRWFSIVPLRRYRVI